MKRLESTEKRLQKDKGKAMAYDNQMQEMEKKKKSSRESYPRKKLTATLVRCIISLTTL